MKPLKADLLEQFKGRVNINAVMDVLDKHLFEVYDLFETLKSARTIEYGVGRQLDYVGDIVGLTRAEANVLLGKDVMFELTDDRYRKLLLYKAYKNTSGATYYDVIRCLRATSNVKDVSYKESDKFPATAIYRIKLGDSQSLGMVPILRAAGVNVAEEYELKSTLQISHNLKALRYTAPFCDTFWCGTYPPN